MFGFFGPGMGGGVFEAHYRAMPVAFIDKHSAEHGDKVILPPSALERLASLNIEYPMLFKVENAATGRFTHTGVLEFVADEGVVYMPHWMMQNLLLEVGDMVKFRNVSLPKGTYVKLQPVTSDFLDISNPKAVLERTLRGYTCLTVGDCFIVNYNNKNFEIEVKEAKPGPAISVVETDCQVDFEAPKDYVEPAPVFRNQTLNGPAASAASATSKPDAMQEDGKSKAAEEEPEDEGPKFLAFAGTAKRLDGKAPSAPAHIPIPSTSGAATSAAAGGTGHAKTPSLSSSPSTAAGGSGKAGTFVGFGGTGSTGNRLLDKLNREKAAAQGTAPKPPLPPTDDKKEEENKFQAFQGKGNRLK